MRNGKVRIKTLNKFLALYDLRRDRNRALTVGEIADAIHCCKGNAYNYLKALEKLFSSMIA